MAVQIAENCKYLGMTRVEAMDIVYMYQGLSLVVKDKPKFNNWMYAYDNGPCVPDVWTDWDYIASRKPTSETLKIIIEEYRNLPAAVLDDWIPEGSSDPRDEGEVMHSELVTIFTRPEFNSVVGRVKDLHNKRRVRRLEKKKIEGYVISVVMIVVYILSLWAFYVWLTEDPNCIKYEQDSWLYGYNKI